VSLRRSVLAVPKMDCAAEEQLVRAALEGEPGVARLAFDLPGRSLVAWHAGDATAIVARLAPLGLGARLVESREAYAAEAAAPPDDATEARTLWTVLAINGAMFVVEVVAGWIGQSTGLLADGFDMLADALVYGAALYAVGRSPALKLRAARLCGWLQLALALAAFAEVGRRAAFGSAPAPPLMMGVSLLALAANVASLLLVARHREGGVHMKATYICTANDVLANAGVIAAGALVAWTGSALPDLVIGATIAGVVLQGALRILRLR
jgi:Co/Zn/Cd efflux system component